MTKELRKELEIIDSRLSTIARDLVVGYRPRDVENARNTLTEIRVTLQSILKAD